MSSENSPKDILKSSDAARIKAYHNYLEKIKSGKTLSKSELEAFKALEEAIESIQATPTKCKTVIEVAALTGFSTRKIYWHITRGNLEQNADGSFDMDKLDAWAAKYKKNTSVSGKTTTREKKESIDLEWKKLRTEREQIMVDQMKGNLLPRDEIMQAIKEVVLQAKRGFMIIPRSAPSVLYGQTEVEMMQTLEKMVLTILTGMSQMADIKTIEKRIIDNSN